MSQVSRDSGNTLGALKNAADQFCMQMSVGELNGISDSELARKWKAYKKQRIQERQEALARERNVTSASDRVKRFQDPPPANDDPNGLTRRIGEELDKGKTKSNSSSWSSL
ncbi:MAG: hypothetical protein SGARI_004280, partial [Bacillariaceae sp.]